MFTFLKYLGKAFLFVLKEVLRFFIGITLLFLLVFFILSNTKEVQSKKISLDKHSYLNLSFEEELRESSEIHPFSFKVGSINFYRVISLINKSADDSKIDGITLDLDKMNISRSHMEEISKSLKNFKKSGKPIFAFGSNLDNSNYLMASVADKIIMPPSHSTNVSLSGYYREFPYFKGLGDKLGIKYNVVHIGDYKTYGENYTKNTMSDEFRAEVSRVYNKLLENFINDISQNRDLNRVALAKHILDGSFVSNDSFDALKNKLADELLYHDEFVEKYGIKNSVEIGDYSKYISTALAEKNRNKIAVIYAEGPIYFDGIANPKEGSVRKDEIIRQINDAEVDDDVKAIVLRVNSPGGSALASELIHHRISICTKPVYISLGSVAASGGYYISAAGGKIFANRSTITGSIGVVSLIPNIEGLVDRVQINLETVDRGKHSGIYSITKEPSREELNLLRNSSLQIYNEFKKRVSKGRNIPMDQLEYISQGKIWLGTEAVSISLIDGIASLNEVINIAAEEQNLGSFSVIEMKKEIELKHFLEKGFFLFNSLFNMDIKLGKFIYKNEIFKRPLTLFPYDICI